jgi:hypothetical protein
VASMASWKRGSVGGGGWRHGSTFRRRWRRGFCIPEGEDVLDEGYVTGDVHTSCRHVVATIPAMVAGVPEEHTRHGARSELVRRRWRDVGVAEAAEHAKLGVGGRCAEEQLVRGNSASGTAGAAVDDVGRRVQGLGPEGRRCCTMD